VKAVGRGLLGVALAVAVPFTYLEWWASDARFGEKTWLCWLAIGLGVAIAAWTALRPPAGTTRAGRVLSILCLVLTLAAGGFFAFYVNGLSYQLPPPAWGRLELGRPLPAITLPSADGRRIDLAKESREGSLKGRKLLLSFFRGHW
jgi:hypothetical protein